MTVQCDARCQNSSNKDCSCVCKGKNHGKGEANAQPVFKEEADPTAARELELYIENNGDLYRRQHEPIIKNLERKDAKGIYDSEKAAKLFTYLAESGAKEYTKENGGTGYGAFNPATRYQAAVALRNTFEREQNTRRMSETYKSKESRSESKKHSREVPAGAYVHAGVRRSQSEYGQTVSANEDATYAWAHREGQRWPGSTLSGHKVNASFDKHGDLVDLDIDGGKTESDSLDGTELNAFLDDLRGKRP